MVRSNDIEVDVTVESPDISKQLQRKYGFLMYENRLCVAMSRQKRALICVGDSTMLKGAQAVKAVAPLVEYYKYVRRMNMEKSFNNRTSVIYQNPQHPRNYKMVKRRC